MKILAIDTSSKNCSVAITEDLKEIVRLDSNDEKTHSVKLMPMIDNAFASSKLSLKDIDLLVCSIGPGSFTGVRIGISTLKAFADVTNILAVGVSSLEGLVYNLDYEDIPTFQLPNVLFCSMIDAKNNNVYCGLYRHYNNCLNQTTDLIAEDIETVISKINTISSQFSQIMFVGDGATLYKEKIEKEIDCKNMFFSTLQQNNACSTSIAKAGYIRYKHGEAGNSTKLSPLYLRKPQAERELEEKERK